MVYLGTLLGSEKIEICDTDDRMAEKYVRYYRNSYIKRLLQNLNYNILLANYNSWVNMLNWVLLRGLKHSNHKFRLHTKFRKDIQW